MTLLCCFCHRKTDPGVPAPPPNKSSLGPCPRQGPQPQQQQHGDLTELVLWGRERHVINEPHEGQQTQVGGGGRKAC